MYELINENPEQKQDKKEIFPLLNPIDLYVVERGMDRLYDHLSQLPRSQFPELIIFPESSARPLALGVKAILEHICNKYHLPIPLFRFMLTTKEPENITENSKETLRLRAEELLKESSPKNIFVVDDTLHTGATLKTLHEAFPVDSSLHLSYFAFYNTEGLDFSDDERERLAYSSIVDSGLSKDQIYAHFGFTEEREEEIIDAEFLDYAVEPATTLEKDLIKYGGFTYRLPERHRLPFKKSMVTGVTKKSGDLYSQPAEDADLDKMWEVRGKILERANHVIKQKNLH